MPADLPVGISERFQSPDFQPFLVNHALQRGNYDQGSDGERKNREHIGHALEHLGIASCH